MPRRKKRPGAPELAGLKEELRKEDKLLHEHLNYVKKHLDKLWEYATDAKDRLQDLEIQVNLLTRLVTTLCLEVLKINPKALSRLIKKVEKEAIADSQVMHLEELFRLEHPSKKEDEPRPRKGD